MDSFKASDFFDLERYEHRSIFADTHFVWEAIAKIASYLELYACPTAPHDYPGATLVNPDKIYIGEDTVIEPGAYIEGPCIIGKKCTIRHAAYIRSNVITGDRCVIGHCTELKNVILLDGAHLAHFAYAGDSICGNNCNLGAGAKLANLKLDGSQVILRNNGKRYPTNLRKFGAIVGDNSQLGCNCVTNPGTLIGKNSEVYPCINFGGIVATGHSVRPAHKPMIISKTVKNI